ncbi:hypothetical protein INR49_023485 [Caranx melampygus]|nr:hypothetical protein INR49_023485 [Caranx melampygus]
MIHVPRTPEFSNCGNMNSISMHTSSVQDLDSMLGGRGRQRSHSYYSPEDKKNYGLQTETDQIYTRPRSRSFYSYETSELHSHCETEIFGWSSPLRQTASSLHQHQETKKESKGDGAGVRATSKKSKLNKHSPSRELSGSKGSLKSVSMMTISESDNWEISSSSGMKYGQFVDWEMIDPEAAKRYKQILRSEHQQLKTMGREGFWAMPHTLRAKAYYHIIHSINSSRSGTTDRDVFHKLTKKLYGEQKISSHQVPEYMEAGEIPRYCLNEAGLNSVKKILLCLGKYFPDMNFCPILPALVSLIIHFSQDEAECFHSVARLICYNDPNKRYIDQTFLTYRASCMTFGDLANRCCKGIRKLIASSHQNLFEFYSDWIMWIFADLPFTYAIRVLDVYLLEGYKVLYRVALALLSLYKVSVTSRVADVEDFRTDMKRFVQNVARHCTVEKLLEAAFLIPMATRRELNLLFNANKDSLMQKGVSIHQKRQSVETVNFTNFSSSVVTGTEMRVIWAWIPERFALFSPIRLFSTAEHGGSLASFYSHVEGHEPVVLMIKTVDEEVFGTFLSTDMTERRKHDSEGISYFGTGECFVFTLRPSMERYQRAMVNIITRRAPPQQVHISNGVSSQVSNCASPHMISALTCPAGTPQDPSFLTIPFTAPAGEPITASEIKRAKEQEASMFIAGDDNQLIIAMDSEANNVSQLELEAVIGFNGHVVSGLRVHPDGEHLVYPLGCTVILKRIKDGKQEFLHGHSNNVSCVSVSKTGSYIASGQVNFMGFKATVIIWDYARRRIYAQLLLHKAKVEALAFSPNEKYLVSLGGQDDGSVVIWNIETKQAICGSPASAHSAGHCLTLEYSNTSDNIFVTAGSGTLRVWELDLPNRKIRPTECQTGKLKRIVKCLEISEDDKIIFCGTTSGDIMKINMKTGLLSDCGPVKKKYSLGVNVLRILKSGDLLVGSGSGTFALCSKTNFKILQEVQLEKGVTSIAVKGDSEEFFVGTEAAQIYRFSSVDFKAELISTSHSSAVKDVAIVFGTSELFASCSEEDIRLWHKDKPKELLRITVPNMTCNSLDFMADGHSIISAWDDGKIRVFAPESGQLMLVIHHAHSKGVTAIAGTRNCKRIISGGGEGQVRVWELLPNGHRLLETMKEHKATVACIKIKSDDKECVSASSDGACIIWDIVMSGKPVALVVYWDVYDGSAIREVEGSLSGAINGLHISQDGKYFVTGGDDKLVKVWDYMGGVVTHIGMAHGGSITSIKICSNNRILVSTSADGAILRWRFPHPSFS